MARAKWRGSRGTAKQTAAKVASFTQKISPVKAEKTDFRLKIAKKPINFAF